ncbi:hypothetical protein [Chryseobacterium shigense]|uniref:Putative chitinase n=1 Tax=Chryseobacterium shigense TaxID=297244 RepID=A0A841NDE8_9FLAO|nr:hypothetical protein [Chryseobacterium shigense]MBB6370062.1 putative chitinase [Chryseobacterium shigense]
MAGGNITRIVGGTNSIETEEWIVRTNEFSAYAGKGSYFTADGGTIFGEPKDSQEASENDNSFVPIVLIDESDNELYKVSEEQNTTWTLDSPIDEDKRKTKSMVIRLKSKEKTKIKFNVKKGYVNANDSDGGIIKAFYFKADDQKSGVSTEHEVSGYDTTIELELSKEQGYHHIQFYADDNDSFFDGGVKNVYCGAVKLTGCYCKRDFTVEELKKIIIELRKLEKTGATQTLRDKNNTSRYEMGEPVLDKDSKIIKIEQTQYDELGENLFNLNLPEKINSDEANFKSFTAAINKAMTDYEINTCIRKIHFLAQCYHETQRFTLSYEERPKSTYHGGEYFRGRGLIQVTHDDWGYLPYYKYLYPTCKEKTDPIDRNSNFYKTVLIPFCKNISTKISYACDSAGWNWKFKGVPTVGENINLLADKDNVLLVSRAINGNVTSPYGLDKREEFTNFLKQIMKYNECENH